MLISLPQSLKVQIHTLQILTGACPKKIGPFHWLGVVLNHFMVPGHIWDHMGSSLGSSLISRGMGGQEKKRGFSDFVLYPLVHREFPKAESGEKFSFDSNLQRYILILLCGEQ